MKVMNELYNSRLSVNGRVESALGRMDKYDSFLSNQSVPNKYSKDPRFNDLVKDPAHTGGTKEISSRTRQEAMAALEAESQGYLKKPIRRGTAEVDFIDGRGTHWDIKTPPSTSYFIQNVGGLVLKIKAELGKGRNILLDCTNMTKNDHVYLRSLLENSLSQAELARIVEINVIFSS